MIRLYGSILALSLLLACCSCGRSTPGPAAAMLTQPTVGQGVEPETMAVLQRELSRLLEESAQARQQSTLLRPDAGRIVLLHESGRLVWDYSFSGDYDQNGVVNAADLVPLGQYFGQSGPFDRSDIRSLVDGDGNGSINLSDVAPIAQNFGNSFVGYAVHASSDPLDYPAAGGDNGPGSAELARLGNADAAGSGRLQFSYPLELEQGVSYWVRSLAAGPQASSTRILLSGWNQPGGDSRRTGRSPFYGPVSADLLWSVKLSESKLSSPVLDVLGNIYIGSTDGQLHAVNRSGGRLWEFGLGSSYSPQTAVDLDGNILSFIGPDGFSSRGLYLLDRSGELLSRELDIFSISGLALDEAGNRYQTVSRNVNCYGPDGELAWQYAGDAVSHTSPSVGPDQTVYTGRWDAADSLLAIGSDGELKWKHNSGVRVGSGISVADDGQLYFCSPDDRGLHSVNPDGSGRWVYYSDNQIPGTPALDRDGNILLSELHGSLLSISPEKELRWSFPNGADSVATPLTDGRGNIYIGGNAAYCLSAEGDLIWSHGAGMGLQFSSPAIGDNAVVYFGCSDGQLYAFGENRLGVDATDGSSQSHVEVLWDRHPLADAYRIQLRDVTANRDSVWQELGTADALKPSWLHEAGSAIPCQTDHMYEYRVLPLMEGNPLAAWSNSDRGFRQSGYQPSLVTQMSGMNPGQTSLSPLTGPVDPKQLWRFDFENAYSGSVVIAADGSILFNSYRDHINNSDQLYCLSSKGKLRWSYDPGNHLAGDPAIGPDGTIYISEEYRDIHALRSDGSLKWKFPAWGSVNASPIVTADGTIYIVNNFGLHSISPQGRGNWHFEMAGIAQDPCISQDGLIHLNAPEGLVTIDGDGMLVSVVELPGKAWSPSPMLLPDGNIAVNRKLQREYLFGVQPGGEIIWSQYVGSDLHGNLALSAAGEVLYSDNSLRSFDMKTGQDSLAGVHAGNDLFSPLACHDGRIYVGSVNGYIKCLDSNGSRLWLMETDSGIFNAPALDAAGRLYVGAGDSVYAFGD